MNGLLPGAGIKDISGTSPRLVTWLIIAGAFADASVFPFPIATLFVMAVLIYPEKSRRLVSYGIMGTISGAVAGYLAGRYAWIGSDGGFTALARFIFSHIPGFTIETYQKAGEFYEKWRMLILFLGAFTPIPYSLFSVTSGVFVTNQAIFIIITLFSHVIKYGFLSFLSVKLSDKVMKYLMISKRAGVAVLLAIVVIAVITAYLTN